MPVDTVHTPEGGVRRSVSRTAVLGEHSVRYPGSVSPISKSPLWNDQRDGPFITCAKGAFAVKC